MRRLASLSLLLAGCGGGGDGPTPPPSLTGIGVSPSTVTLQGVGSTATLSASTQPVGVNAVVSWSSSNSAVATVAGSGSSATVTAVSGGSTQITARAGSFTAVVTATVVPLVRAVALPPDTLSLVVGATSGQQATVTADAGADATLAWTTADGAIATVSAAGAVTAIAPGVTQLTVSVPAFPSVSATRAVRVRLPDVQVAVTPAMVALPTGQSAVLAASVSAPAGVSTDVTWTSSASAIAAVSASGTVTGVSPGTAQITVASVANPAASAVASVTVRSPTVQSLVVQPDSLSLLPGVSQTLQLTVTADSGVNNAVLWISSDVAIATVSDAGVVTAVAPGGPILITATSVAAPAVVDSSRVWVVAPPVNTNFVAQRVGVGGSAGGYGGLTMQHFGPSDLLATVGFRAAGGGAFANGVLRMQSGSVTDVTAACCTVAGLPRVIAGESVDDALITFPGTQAIGGTTPRVMRRTASGYVDSNWPVPPGFPHTLHRIRAFGNGEYLALATNGEIFRLAAGVWSKIGTVTFGTANTTGEDIIIDRDEIVSQGCTPTGTPQMQRWKNNVQTILPSAPGVCTSVFNDELRGLTINGMRFVNPQGLFEFNGTTWQSLAAAVIGADTVISSVRCADGTYGVSRRGFVFELMSGQFSLIGEPGEVTALQEFDRSATIDCHPSGPLRVLSGGARLMRRAGSGWVEENYAPNLPAVHVSSPAVGYAVGDGVVYRWNGAIWSRARLFVDPDLRMNSVVSWPDGRMVAVGEVGRSGSSAVESSGALHFDGVAWNYQPLPQFTDIDRMVPLGANSALAVVRTGTTTPNTVARLDGSSWTTMSTGLSAVSLVHASDAQHAIALSGSGTAARYNGSNWLPIQSIPGTFTVFSGGLFVASPTFAMAGSCVTAGDNARLVQFDGTAWTDTPTNGLPPFRCVTSLFGTSATDVYAMTLNTSNARVLLHWDGTAWTSISSADFSDARAGSAVPGLAVLSGFRAYTAVARPPAARRSP